MISEGTKEEVLEQFHRPSSKSSGSGSARRNRSSGIGGLSSPKEFPTSELPLDSYVVGLQAHPQHETQLDRAAASLYEPDAFLEEARQKIDALSYYATDDEHEERISKTKKQREGNLTVFQRRMNERHRPTHILVRVRELELDGDAIRKAGEKGWLRRLPRAIRNPLALHHHEKDKTGLDTVACVIYRDKLDPHENPPRPDSTSPYSALREVALTGENEFSMEAVWGESEGQVSSFL